MGRRQRWGAAALLASLGLVALVAVTADGRPLQAPLSEGRVDVSGWVAALGLVGVLLGLAIAALSVWSMVRSHEPSSTPAVRRRRLRGGLVVALAVVVALLFGPATRGKPPQPAPLTTVDTPAVTSEPGTPERSPLWPVVLLGGLVTAVLLAALAPRRRASAAATVADAPTTAAATLAASVDALVDDPDPRTAIVAAYRVLLDGFERCGLGRRPAEAPHEHLRRALGALDVRPAPLEELVELYDVARFSEHPLTPADRSRALAAFGAARDDLLAAA